jgi:hypothetical protein
MLRAMMARTILRTLAVASLAAPALQAQAADWTIRDLGRLYKDEHCLHVGQRTFRDMLGEAEIAMIRNSDWVIYADGVNGLHDAVITCTYGDNRGTRATLVIHSRERPIDGRLLARRIETIFASWSERVTQAWKDSFK